MSEDWHRLYTVIEHFKRGDKRVETRQYECDELPLNWPADLFGLTVRRNRVSDEAPTQDVAAE